MTDQKMDMCVFAAPFYVNAAPLTSFLGRVDAGASVSHGRPAEMAELLLNGSADVALLPVADFFAIPGLRMIDGLGICADGDVWSVLLKCHRPLHRARFVGLDPASKTSNALAEILLEDHFHLSVQTRYCAPDEPVDAAVVIGDRALCAPPAANGDYDLAGVWKETTGLPFVFAVWAYRDDHPDPKGLSRIAHAARDAGGHALNDLAAAHAGRLELPPDLCREYLASVIHYDLGPRETTAMQLFKQLLDKRGRGLPPTPPPSLARSGTGPGR